MTGYRFTAPLWLYPGEGSWYFVTVPEDISDEITDLTEGRRKGFGSVRVSVTVGGSTWQTSVFPTKNGTYMLPVKKAIRTAEDLLEGSPVETQLELVDF
ncbi:MULTISPECIES: DUF1905 domain-containing protein [Kribbella]|uniref:Uncharacterized protein DUF1905 n=1 Tax=Kribbella pratensis TaxID=2512112 RepID=A0ABY2FAT0_9ACTN|nr:MULTISPECIES: DUF1905 domain-containing protein [Kribbella]TDW87371.1 uncharacterized protein DUF1905 [Kribbella pratensis]TDW91320.1 uncharacterized protein DUF1905 [Kribbella sp. VKM Ac-2566]